MDDNYDTYKIATIEINRLFFKRLINYLIFKLNLTCERYIFDRVTQK
jgi:hypothetical protein